MKKDIIEYTIVFFGSIVMACLIVLLFTLLTGCKLTQGREVNRSTTTTDSAGIKKQTESLIKIDTSKSKSETTYLKETYIYPPKDTIINNYYPASPSVYIRESGNSKNESQNYNYEERLRQSLDSMRIANLESELNKKIETRVKVLDFWQILALGILGFIVLYLIGKNFITLKK